jgi:hypothetical protein
MESLVAGPTWNTTKIKLDGYKTESPIILYWRDGLEVIQHLFSNPIFASSIEMMPYHLYDTNGVRMYHEFMSADEAWKIQVCPQWRITALSFIGCVGSTAPWSQLRWSHCHK